MNPGKLPKINVKKYFERSGSRKNMMLLEDDSLRSVLNDNILNNDILFVKLRHPGTGKPANFYIKHVIGVEISDSTDKIYELISYNEEHRAWLVDNSLSPNHVMHMSIPADPMFFALYYLHEFCQTQAKPLMQLPEEECRSTITEVLANISSEDLSRIADEKTVGNMKAYMYNEEKAMRWLQLKTNYLAGVLEKRIISHVDSPSSACYGPTVDSIPHGINRSSDNTLLALDVLKRYIKEDIVKKLEIKLGVHHRKRNITSEGPCSSKRLKISEETNNFDQNNMRPSTPERPCSSKMFETNNLQIQSFHEKPKKQNKNVKRLQKAATGSKNIKSFFKKDPKI